jgi:hypothetical protein
VTCFIDLDMLQDIPFKTETTGRCRQCCEPMPEAATRCARCGAELPPPAPKSLLGKIKRVLGIDLSSDIIAINLEDNQFFTDQEIDALLDMENVTVLGLEDVPDRAAMFYNSKRIRKPLNRKKS